MEIKIVDYTKVIKKNTILNNINFTFESGKIYGLHGRNGSGKTMLMRAIAGLILPTQGYVSINDKIIGKDMDFPGSCGVLIENMNLIQENSGLDNLKLLARIKKIITIDEIKNVMCELGLDPDNKKSIRTYSLGMKQKLNIAQAIMEKPKLLLLDEPTNALDEKSVSKVKDILIEARNQGALIIIASHNKEDLMFLSDEIIEIENGRIVN
ncbi:MAG: ABC transporter ATP-binding protein [Acutalibacteraceae bacterium]|nr:ABC transporter ATP-binding protein [Acutalibacteraceae bacterium]